MSYTPNVLRGTQDDGTAVAIPVTPEGHVEVAIHGPRLPFGSVHVESLTPIIQVDAVYGINSNQIIETTGHATGGVTSGTNTGTGNLLVSSTGTTSLSFATMQSRQRLRYRPGQGIVGRYTAKFSTPAASSILVAGWGTAESGFYFGYNGTSFGILHVTGGVREIRTLTVTTASTSTQPYQVVLNSATAVNVTATNNGSTVKTAWEIAQGTFPGWTAMAVGSTVVFLNNSSATRGGTYSLAQSGAGTPAAGSYVQTLAGAASTDTWVAQSSWNGDKLDGTGPSGFTLDPSKGNVFQINVQYLGFGTVAFMVEVTTVNGNNADFVTCHTLKFPNTLTTPSVSQPSFPFTMAAYSAGSTTNVSVSVASFAGFVEGEKQLNGPRMSYQRTSTAVTTGAYYALMTIRNKLVYKTRANQAVVNLVSWAAAHDDTTPVLMVLIKNGTLAGTPSFSDWDPQSCTDVDTSATTVTVANNDQLIYQLPVGQSGSLLVQFADAIRLQPGETITLAAQTVTGTATYTMQNLNTREDQ